MLNKTRQEIRATSGYISTLYGPVSGRSFDEIEEDIEFNVGDKKADCEREIHYAKEFRESLHDFRFKSESLSPKEKKALTMLSLAIDSRIQWLQFVMAKTKKATPYVWERLRYEKKVADLKSRKKDMSESEYNKQRKHVDEQHIVHLKTATKTFKEIDKQKGKDDKYFYKRLRDFCKSAGIVSESKSYNTALGIVSDMSKGIKYYTASEAVHAVTDVMIMKTGAKTV